MGDRRIDTKYFKHFERVGAVTRTDRGLLAEVENERLRIDVLRDDVLRVKMSRGGVFDEKPTFAVDANAVDADLKAAPPAFAVEEGERCVRLRTARLALTLWTDTFRLDAHRADGSVLFETAQDADGHWGAYATLNDEFIVSRRCRQDDAFYGLGEKTGRFNRRGRDFTLWNTDVLSPDATGEFTALKDKGDPRGDNTSTEFDPYYVSIPFFYHAPQTHMACDGGPMAGVFVDNAYRGHFEFSRPSEYRFHFQGGQYTEYVFAGPSMREILSAYTWLTGRMPPPPLWALGYHQCRWFEYAQADVEALAARHRQRGIPCDALWLDIEYMDGYRVFTWDEAAFPDAPGMLERLSAQKFRTITIIDPGVKHEPGYWVFDQAVERDLLCKTEGGDTYIGQVWPGRTAFPDFATPEARDWWGELNAAHVRSGLAGIWNDMNEPATGDIPPDAMRFGGGRHPHARFHNQYALLMAMGTTDGLRRAMPDRRTFVLSRAGFSGIQRYAANWMGDNFSRWDHLWLSLPMALGFGVSGQPFVGADIGGFAGSTHAELFLRWMQCGVLTPFCRNHSNAGNVDQYVWSFGGAVEDLCRRALRLRYRLLPYIYATFLRSSETGEPVQKPLVFEFQDDAAVRDMDDEYLFGSDLLVAPIYAPGQTSRPVYLPAGTWYDWHTGEQFGGGRFITAPAPLEYIPLYARGGAVIPMWPEAPASTADYHPRVLELHLFVPDADGEHRSFLHEDDGLTFAFRDGAFYQTVFHVRRDGGLLTVQASVTGNGYPEFAREEFRVVLHGASVARVRVDGRDVAVRTATVVLSNSGQSFTLAAELAV